MISWLVVGAARRSLCPSRESLCGQQVRAPHRYTHEHHFRFAFYIVGLSETREGKVGLMPTKESTCGARQKNILFAVCCPLGTRTRFPLPVVPSIQVNTRKYILYDWITLICTTLMGHRHLRAACLSVLFCKYLLL